MMCCSFVNDIMKKFFVSVIEMKEENVSGVVSFSMCDSQRILHQILIENELPHLPVPPTYCFRYDNHNGRSPWRIRNRASYLISAILAVIIKLKSLHLKELIIFFDGTFGKKLLMKYSPLHREYGPLVKKMGEKFLVD